MMRTRSPLSRLLLPIVISAWISGLPHIHVAGEETKTTSTAAASEEFFETRIRPVLVEHCYQCHSSEADEIGGGLWLDTAEAMREGGDSGPAVQAGKIDQSVLISAIRYESAEMPPSGKLPEPIIKDFENWIAAGAIDPRTSLTNDPRQSGETKLDMDAGRAFWAFQPLNFYAPPISDESTKDAWIDAFLDHQLVQAGITPNPRADVDTELRRLAFDLTGLPPTPEKISRWRSDPSDSTWLTIVDELLASPGFAEHWARHWMDVARYADSNGSDFNATFHDAWRYRDYLIRNIAADTPVDEMIRQQIAGDLLPARTDDDRHDNLVATTFLMLGTKMLSERDKAKLTMDVVDEQIDTVGRAFLGLTLGCARCHDHKFDPVPMQDYYALAGIFRSTLCLQGESQKYVSTWKPMPLPTSDTHRHEVSEHQSKVAELKAAIKKLETQIKQDDSSSKRLEGIVIDDIEAIKTGDWTTSTYIKNFIGSGYVHDDNRDKGKLSITFSTKLTSLAKEASTDKPRRWEARLWYTSGGTRANKVPVEIRIGESVQQRHVDQSQSNTIVAYASLGEFDVPDQANVSVVVSNAGTAGYVTVDAVQWLPVDGSVVADAPAKQDDTQLKQWTAEREHLTEQLDSLVKNPPPPLPTCMAVQDRDAKQIADCPLHIRGEVNNLADTVPRGFLSVLDASENVTSPRQFSGSGRLELAAWLTDPDQPLTPRVAVNRIWMRLMGEGLVRTVDNFGQRGERPTHPELLDAIAVDFIRHGWSRKHLIRQIVMSNAYRRSSMPNEQSVSIDPENRLLWRGNRKRLTAESIRDGMLVVAGILDRSAISNPMNGYGVLVSSNDAGSKAKVSFSINDPRRTLYLPVIRGETPALLSVLDVADADLLVGKRPTTNVPAQALALVGSEEVRQWAGQAATRMLNDTDDPARRVDWVYEHVLQRLATSEDRALIDAWLMSETAQALPNDQRRWQEWIAAMFASTEFRFLD
jgi:hypothetical protein